MEKKVNDKCEEETLRSNCNRQDIRDPHGPDPDGNQGHGKG